MVPGLVAATSMTTVVGEVTYPVMAMVKWNKTYFSMTATPLGVREIALAHLGFVAFRVAVTAAVFLNVSTALAEVDPLSARDTGWQVVVLVLAALTLLALTVLTGGVLGYALAGAWAMLGIAVTAAGEGTTAVLVTAVVSGLLLLAALAALGTTGGARRAA